MKFYNLIFICFCFAFVCSCDDDEIIPEPQLEAFEEIPVGSIQATFGTEEFSTSNINVTNINPDLITLNASAGTTGIGIILEDSAIASYPIGGLNNLNSLAFNSVSEDNGSINFLIFTSIEQSNASGSINILAVDLENSTISGTFEGIIVDDTNEENTLNITNGLFNQIPFE